MSITAWITVIKETACANQGSIYSDPIDCEKLSEFSIKALITAGTGDVTVSYEICDSPQAQPAKVTADIAQRKYEWTTPNTAPDLLTNVITAVPQADGFAPMVSRWMRIKVTGNAGNGADSVVTAKLGIFSE